MGLRARIDLKKDWGFPSHTPLLHIPIDYEGVVETFGEATCKVAKSICPVDTGYLQSSIDWQGDDTRGAVEAKAEYAQYVEYGTWKMRAQPYFTPAVEYGAQLAFTLAAQIYANAIQEEEMALYGESDFSGSLMGETALMSQFTGDGMYGGSQQIIHGIAFNRDGSVAAGSHGYYNITPSHWRPGTTMYNTAVENQRNLGAYRAEAMARFQHDDAIRSRMINGANLSSGFGSGQRNGVSNFAYGVGMYAMSSITLSTGNFMAGFLGGLLLAGIATLFGLILSDIFGPSQPEYKAPEIIIT